MILGKHGVALRLIKLMLVVGALALGGALHYLSAATCSRAPVMGVVQQAPAGPLVETLDGRSIGLADIAPGKRVAIIVMKGTWCGVCTSQLARLQERATEYNANAVVVGLNAEDALANNHAASLNDLSMPIFADGDLDAIRSFGLEGPNHPVPGVVFLNETGDVVDIVKGRYPGRPQEDWVIDRLR